MIGLAAAFRPGGGGGGTIIGLAAAFRPGGGGGGTMIGLAAYLVAVSAGVTEALSGLASASPALTARRAEIAEMRTEAVMVITNS
jgi:hypothetical protein